MASIAPERLKKTESVCHGFQPPSKTSHFWTAIYTIAGIPSETFEHRLEHLKQGEKEITSTEFLRLAKRLASSDKPRKDEGAVEEVISEEFRSATEALRKAIIFDRSSGWQGTSRTAALALVKSLVTMIRV